MGKIKFGENNKEESNMIMAIKETSKDPIIQIQEKIVEVPVDRIVEKIVEVEKIVNIPVEVEKIVNIPVEVEKITNNKVACSCKDYSQDIKNCREASEIRDEELNDLYESLLSEQQSLSKKHNSLDMDMNSLYKMHDLKFNELENKIIENNKRNKMYLLIMGGLLILSLLI